MTEEQSLLSKEAKRISFETYYRECWLKQLVVDQKGNPLARHDPLARTKPRSPERNPVVLTQRAAIVNRMLLEGMKGKQIGNLLGCSQQSVSEIKQKYGLPKTNGIKSDKG
tara:strand:+ start:600 stop:932 length:333 start_codon:yes stop_codon:yes gene_type:complete